MWRSATLHTFVNIPEEPAGSIFYPEAGGNRFLLKVGKFYQTTWCHVKEDRNPHSQSRKISYPTAVAYRRGVWGSNPSTPEIPKALQNRAKLNPIVKTVKNL